MKNFREYKGYTIPDGWEDNEFACIDVNKEIDGCKYISCNECICFAPLKTQYQAMMFIDPTTIDVVFGELDGDSMKMSVIILDMKRCKDCIYCLQKKLCWYIDTLKEDQRRTVEEKIKLFTDNPFFIYQPYTATNGWGLNKDVIMIEYLNPNGNCSFYKRKWWKFWR